MKLHDLKPAKGSKRKRTRVGRGIAAGQGTYAGRGIKGQKARQGERIALYFEGGQLPLVRRLPFKRGFNNIFRIQYQEVSLKRLDSAFDAGTTITPQLMAEKRLIRDALEPVVILGNGDLTKKLVVHAQRVTKGARAKIEGAGGSVEILPLRLTGARATVRKLRKSELAKLFGEQQS